MLSAGGWFALGLIPYVYLPLRSLANPPLDWANPETLNGFLDSVLRRKFWARAFIQGPWDLLPISADYLRSLTVELTWSSCIKPSPSLMG